MGVEVAIVRDKGQVKAAGGGVGPCVVAQSDKYPGVDRLGCHDEFIFDIEIDSNLINNRIRSLLA